MLMRTKRKRMTVGSQDRSKEKNLNEVIMMIKKKRHRKSSGFWSSVAEGLKLDLFFQGMLAIFKFIFKIIGSIFD
ncbi:hypothetical protein PQE74_gp033 [Bacillus phage vB_BanS_Chewbecca]|uniref:Uncharacterized protein n=1 Tax=Bacillus phage vB_BanS_Chewbecca TaxID=2894786 RepID=A0AAE8YME8_9CAUD|nr:hypothetical protein PQE74_gp033 [Bacillus phage vB_BanS_Chewbecca]UGO46116.1 hypothetical protein CHEWBECCA_33 [Bacillus phage vB_BanS_Chewbecca]